MARILGLLPEALVAARGGLSATQFYNDLKNRGIAPRKSEAYALYRYAVGIVEQYGNELFRNQKAIPSANDLVDWPVKKATGISQRVMVVIRDKQTGAQSHSYFNIVTESGVTREEAKAAAIAAYERKNEGYKSEIINAVHVGAYRQIPFKAS